MFYQLEYAGGFHYIPKTFHNSKQEQHLDRLLGYFERIALLYEMRVLHSSDLELVQYYLVRVYQHPEIQKYFQYLDKLSTEVGVSGCRFKRYRDVVEKLQPNCLGHQPIPQNK